MHIKQTNRSELITLCIAILMAALGCKKEPPHPGKIVYQTYCTGCHGGQLQGGLAAPLIKTVWKYGRKKTQMYRNIRYGIRGTEMAEWQYVLNEAQIEDVIGYIVESQNTPIRADRQIPDQLEMEDYTIKVEKFGEGLSKPWGIEFISPDVALISEGTGGLRWLINDALDPKPILGIPEIFMAGGMMDLAIDPNYASNGWVYLSYGFTEDSLNNSDSPAMTKIVRGRIHDYEWTDEQVLFEAPDSLRFGNARQWGSRFLFDGDGFLFFTIGDMAQADFSQDISKPVGKVFRINPDGSIPEDNPFVGIPGALQEIYSLGNRNVQGITRDPVSGTIWMTEHGPMGGDELNILKKGANYGWPLVTFGVNYDGKPVSRDSLMDGIEPPITYWSPSIGICPVEFCSSTLFPKWSGNLLVGALAHEEIKRLVVEEGVVQKEEVFLKGMGRVRDIKTHPDGSIYVLLNQPDWVLRLTPESTI